MKAITLILFLLFSEFIYSQAALGMKSSYTITPSGATSSTANATYESTISVACYVQNKGNAPFNGNLQVLRMVESFPFQSTINTIISQTVNIAPNDSVQVFFTDSIVPNSYKTSGNGNTVVVWPYVIGVPTTDSLRAGPVYVTGPNGINELAKNKLYLYPNPSTEKLFIKPDLNEIYINYKIYNIQLQQIKEGSFDKEINIDSLPPGVFTIVITTSKNSRYTGMFTKTN